MLTADACAAAGLELMALPDDLRARIDAMVPARWSRQNPVDLAGGETRDTIPDALDLVCAPSRRRRRRLPRPRHPGEPGATCFRSGPFFPGHGLDRIVEFHERQDRRYAEAARDASERHGKPVLVATELVYADRAYGNAGPRGGPRGRPAVLSERAPRGRPRCAPWSSMSSSGDARRLSRARRVGLCARCRHARAQTTTRGSTFWRCLRAETDARFVRYPALPVRDCPGFDERANG